MACFAITLGLYRFHPLRQSIRRYLVTYLICSATTIAGIVIFFRVIHPMSKIKFWELIVNSIYSTRPCKQWRRTVTDTSKLIILFNALNAGLKAILVFEQAKQRSIKLKVFKLRWSSSEPSLSLDSLCCVSCGGMICSNTSCIPPVYYHWLLAHDWTCPLLLRY